MVQLMLDRSSDAHYKQINSLMRTFVETPSAPARTELQAFMGLDETNFSAFMVLFDRLKNPKVKPRLEIFEPGKNTVDGAVAFPTAIAPKDILAKLPFVNYSELRGREKELNPLASQTALWVKKMQAGTGSTVVRDDYIRKIRSGSLESNRIGAKGTDLYVELPAKSTSGSTELRSLAELQIMQLMLSQDHHEFCEIVFQDLVSTETIDSLERIWATTSYLHGEHSYAEKADHRAERFVQEQVPCIDETYQLSYKRTAPSGHWIFAVDALRAAVHAASRPETSCSHLVATIGNGEDLSSTPDPLMVGWMIKEKVPIVMVTTEKTANDLKGGQIALVRSIEGEDYVTIIEQAQAKEAGQQELFEQIGITIKHDDQMAFFNTNMALFNYDVLVPELEALCRDIGERALLDLLAPDLIMNWKEQSDADGITRKYLQIEGAMGSSLLNFDRFWRKKFGRPLVHFINVERDCRTKFFSPIKTAFDYFMQFHSDRFRLDSSTMRLEHVGVEKLPLVVLKDPATKDYYYADVSTVLTNFEGASIRELTSLTIKGQVSARGLKLSGRVEIVNHLSEVINAASMTLRINGECVLKNQRLLISADGRPTIESL